MDEVNQKRKVVGVGGIDAHAHKVNMLGFFEFEVFPYKVLFKSVRTHILTHEKLKTSDNNDIGHSKRIIYEALKEGHCFVSNYNHGNAASFRFTASAGEKEYSMGDFIPYSDGIKLKVTLPDVSAAIKLIHNGQKTEEITGSKAEFEVSAPGAYRIEVYLNNNAWIFSNHIRIQ